MTWRLLLFWVLLSPVLGWAAKPAAARAPTADETSRWLADFETDYEVRGPEALWSRIDVDALGERALAASGLADKRQRHESLSRTALQKLKIGYAGMRHLRLGRKLDGGDHRSVLAYFENDSGSYLHCRLRIERDEDGELRFTDWAPAPCDVDQSLIIAGLVYVQELASPNSAPHELRAELNYYHHHPERFVALTIAATRGDGTSLLVELGKLPPEARHGLLAREWRSALPHLVPPELGLNAEAIVGPPGLDALRGHLMGQIGMIQNNAHLAARGLQAQRRQLDDDAHLLTELSVWLLLADQPEEAERIAREAAELYPAAYFTHVQLLTILTITGKTKVRAETRARLEQFLNKEAIAWIDQNEATYVENVKKRHAMVTLAKATQERILREMLDRAPRNFGQPPHSGDEIPTIEIRR